MSASSEQSGNKSEISAASLSAGDLRQAFLVFDHASRHLAGSYQDLQAEVERLSMEVVAANARLHAQLHETAGLAERLSELLAALPVGVLVINENDEIAESNATAQALLGKPLAQQRWHTIMRERLSPVENDDGWLCGETGKMVSLLQRSLPSGNGLLIVVSDVTDTLATRKALERSHRLAGLGATSASLAHQLRTPLAAALLYASRLTQGCDRESPVVQMATAVVGQLKSLESFIQESLAYARGEAYWRTEVDLGRLTAEAARMMKSQAEARPIALTVNASSGNFPVLGCRVALLSMLINLLDNALKACARKGEVELHLACEQAHAVIRVSDNGCGMTDEVRQRLFEPYFTTRHDGHGLGLAFVLNVVKAHRGQITVDSGSHRTVFTVRLPLSEIVEQGECHETSHGG